LITNFKHNLYFVSNHPILVKRSVDIFDREEFSKRDHLESELSGKVLVNEFASCSTVDEGISV